MVLGVQRHGASIGDERGFTLVEMLVVMVIIGLLSAIAIPVFFNQRDKGSDTEAVSNVRNLEGMVEACRTDTNDFTQCQTQSQLHADGLTIGSGVHEVSVLPNPIGAGGYAVSGLSSTGTTFAIYSVSGNRQQVCIPAAGESLPQGKCQPGGAYSAYGYGTW